MPEAVASNSIPVSKRQEGHPLPFGALPSYVQREFDDVAEMLRAHAIMATALLEVGDDFSAHSLGVLLVHKLIMRRLDEVADLAGMEIGQMCSGRRLDGPTDSEVLERIGQMVAAAYTEAGVGMRWEERGSWSNDVARLYATATGNYLKELREQIGDDDHLLTVGSFLPWLELKMRREIVGEEDIPSLRDRLIAEQIKAGVPAEEISQAFNVRRSVVERTVARLTADGEIRQAAV